MSAEESALYRNALVNPLAANGGMNWYRANIQPFDTIGSHHFWPLGNPTIRVSKLIIQGEADMAFDPGFLQNLPIDSGLLTVERLSAIGHASAIEAPERVNKVLTTFLRTIYSQ